MKLYGDPPTRAIRALWLLNELGLAHERISVDLLTGAQDEPAFRALNPAGKLPVLVDGDIVLTESAAIPLYLAERYGGGRFLPSDTVERAQMLRWIFFLVTEIEQPLWRVALHTFLYAPAERRQEEIELALRDCRRMLPVLEAHLAGRETFIGDELSVADFIGAYTLDWAREVGTLEGFPALQGFVERMYARPTAPPTIGEAFAALRAGQDAKEPALAG